MAATRSTSSGVRGRPGGARVSTRQASSLSASPTAQPAGCAVSPHWPPPRCRVNGLVQRWRPRLRDRDNTQMAAAQGQLFCWADAAADSSPLRKVVQQLAVGCEASVRAPVPGQLRDHGLAGARSEPCSSRRVRKDLDKPLAQRRTSPGGTRYPVTPSSTISGRPPRRLAITGVPLAIASSATRPRSSETTIRRP